MVFFGVNIPEGDRVKRVSKNTWSGNKIGMMPLGAIDTLYDVKNTSTEGDQEFSHLRLEVFGQLTLQCCLT